MYICTLVFIEFSMHNPKSNATQNPLGKEPWLAVNLSMFFPGIGQIYAGHLIRGCIFIIGCILLSFLGLWLVISSQGNTIIGISCLVASIIVWICSLFDAYNCVVRANALSFEVFRKRSKDPWLAVFLTFIFLGTGHLYIKKYVWGSVLVFITIISSLLPLNTSISLLTIVLPFFIYHVYTSSPVRRAVSKRAILLISILSVVINLIFWLSQSSYVKIT